MIDITQIISKDKFIDYMNQIKADMDRSTTLANTLNDLYGKRQGFYVDFYPSSDLQNLTIKMLSDIFKDKNNWLTYYVYECDFGENKTFIASVTDIDGKKIPFETLSDVYELLVNNYNENQGIN